MDQFPKYISGFPEIDENLGENGDFQNTYVNCNICRNFSNILKLSHRKSKEHQKKMSEKFRAINNQIKKMEHNSIIVHDEEWHKHESLYCYFCDKSISKHKIRDGVMIEHLGYMDHLANPEHVKGVKKYLKYHQRNDKYEIFCKTEKQLNEFTEKIFKARDIYLKSMELLHAKDVQSLREIEESRKILVQEAKEISAVTCDTSNSASKQPYSSSNGLVHKNTLRPEEKVPPWQIDEVEINNTEDRPAKAIIGPTMETLVNHIAAKKRKGLPVKRLGANIKHAGEYSANWMPKFRGVWNKKMGKYMMKRENGANFRHDMKHKIHMFKNRTHNTG